jgi:hypothetical protein
MVKLVPFQVPTCAEDMGCVKKGDYRPKGQLHGGSFLDPHETFGRRQTCRLLCLLKNMVLYNYTKMAGTLTGLLVSLVHL